VSERTEQQAEAVGARDRDVFLRAGAGTGKTTVLVDRFCSAAVEEEVGVERILAFTFTERAADQLRRRVREELARRAASAEGEEHERLAAMTEATDRAWISTIHGFCRRLLAAHPAAAGLDPRFRVVDEPEADRLASRAFDDALREIVEAGGGEALAFAAANRRFMLLQMTRGAYDELRSHGYPEPVLPEPPGVDSSAAIAELVAAAREAHEECAEAKREGELESRERIGAAAALDPAATPDEELLETLRGLEITSGGKVFQGEASERYAAALKRVRAAVATVVLRPAYELLRELVTRFGRRYEELKAERSALDFEDLQLQAVAVLRTSERIRDRYREQFRHLMVDEFQDTNELQLELIEQLRGPDTRLFLVGDEFQSIYGFRHADVDVYRRVHRRFAEGDELNGVALPLTGNFRADPEVLAATNAIGRGLLDGFEPLTSALETGEVVAEGPLVELLLTTEDRKGWEAEETGLPRLDDDPSPAPKVAEARRLAARLRELVAAGEEPTEIVVLLRAFTHVATLERALDEAGLDPYVVGGRGFWSQQPIEDMRALLAAVANPLDDESLYGALASPACAVLPDTLWLLRRAATVEGEDGRERLRHIWPLIRDLVERGEPTEGDREAASLIPEGELGRLRAFAGTLGELRRRGALGGLEALIECAASAFGYDLATLMRDHGRERWANVRKLMRLAREFEAREGPDLGAFLEYLDARSAASDRESEAATRAEGHAGVRVMTVHAAKGLEFGVVAVGDLGRPLRLGWSPLRVSPGGDEPDESARVGVQLGRLGRPSERLGDYEELAELAAEREAEEEARLAYVAATRAKRRLILSGTFNPKRLDQDLTGGSSLRSEYPHINRRKPIALQLIRSVLGGDITPRELEIEAAGEGFPPGRLLLEVLEPGPGVGAGILLRREPERPRSEPAAGRPPLGRPEVPPALIGSLSYSALSEFENCGYRFYVERVLGIGEPEMAAEDEEGASPAPEVRRRFGPGVAVHALLEWSARNRWRDPGAERAAAALREQGLEPTDERVGAALGLTTAFLGSPLRAEIGDAPVSAEVPFVISVGGTLIRGSIDLLVERSDGSLLVVDYKTDDLRGPRRRSRGSTRLMQGREPEAIVSRYAVQRDLYALAAGARGGPVETAYVFLERPEAPVTAVFDEDALEQARARVEELLRRLAAGRFDVTRHPHRSLCLDCPARERLCSHEPAAQLRDDPGPPVEPGGRRDTSSVQGSEGGSESQLSLLEGA
jgi:ATP-dependent helicase/nuclease subunit A